MIKYAPHTMSSAATRAAAKVGKTNAVGMCAREVIPGIFGIPAPWYWGGNGKAWAINYFKGAKERGRVVETSDPKKIPRGAMVFWGARPGATTNGGKAGHVAVGAGNGKCYSTDLPKEGKWGLINIADVERLWGKKLVGYVLEDGTGWTLTDKPAEQAVPTWGKPETWILGGVSPDVTKFGQLLVAHSAALGLPSLYEKGPGPKLGTKDLDMCQRLQSTWWPKASTEPGGGADGYPGPMTFDRLDDPPPAPKSTKRLSVLQWNVAGYNAAKGAATIKTRMPGIWEWIDKASPDALLIQELSGHNTATGDPDFDQKVDFVARAKKRGFLLAPGGTDGRYVLPDGSVLEITWSGHVIMREALEVDDDDKQGAIAICKLDGTPVALGSFHTDNNGRNQVAQFLDFLDQFEAIAAAHGVDPVNCIWAGDCNDPTGGCADAAQKRGYNVAHRDAAETVHADYGTNNRWTGSRKGEEPIDITVSKGEFLKWTQHFDATLSDHNATYSVLAITTA